MENICYDTSLEQSPWDGSNEGLRFCRDIWKIIHKSSLLLCFIGRPLYLHHGETTYFLYVVQIYNVVS